MSLFSADLHASDGLRVSSDRLWVRPEAREALFSNNAYARYQDATLKADHLLITFNAADKPETIEAFGHIHMTADGKNAAGSYAIYENSSQLLTLSGKVTMQQPGIELTGAQFRYDVTDGKAVLKQDDAGFDVAGREIYLKQWILYAKEKIAETEKLLSDYETSTR